MLEYDPYRTIDSVQIYYVDLTEDTAREQYAIHLLNATEQARMQEYRVTEVRRRFVLMRATLRTLLCDRLDCDNAQLDFEKLSHGKPYACIEGASATISFNITHSDTHGLIAIAPDRDIGVDLEIYSSSRDISGITKAVFSPEEQAVLTAASEEQRVRLFYRLWTLKEALLKAWGTGLSLAPASFQIPDSMLAYGNDSGIISPPQDPESIWRLESIGNERFAAAAAWKSDPLDDTD